MKRAVWLALGIGMSLVAACKDGKGERCQITADCSGGLVCAAATNTCETSTGVGIDAQTPDAHVVLDSTIDAPVDATPSDAPHD